MGIKFGGKQQYSIAGRVAIGEKSADRGLPKKLDYFIFTKEFDKKLQRADRDKQLSEIMTQKYGTNKPKSIEIVLLEDHPDEVFFSSYMNYPNADCNCKGDGEKASRLINGEWKEGKCNYETCKFRLKTTDRGIINTCKPTGILSFAIQDAPVVGGIYRFVTHSQITIKRIMSSLYNIYELRGSLKGLLVRMNLKTIQVNVNGDKQNVHVVEIDTPFSESALRLGEGTVRGNLELILKNHQAIGYTPNKEILQTLAADADDINKNEYTDNQQNEKQENKSAVASEIPSSELPGDEISL